MKLDIQLFGGRGAASGGRALAKGKNLFEKSNKNIEDNDSNKSSKNSYGIYLEKVAQRSLQRKLKIAQLKK